MKGIQNNSSPKKVLVLSVMVVVIMAGFFFLLKRSNERTESESQMTQVKALISKNLEISYPSTPREVLKLYGRIMKCLYIEKLGSEEKNKLADQIRLLFDQELLEKNPRDKYLEKLSSDITKNKSEGRAIMTINIENSSQIKYSTIDKKEYAAITASLFSKEKVGYSRTYEEFILRKDSNEKWKIIGWKKTKPANIDE